MSKEEFQLPDEYVTVKFIPRKKGIASNVEKNHIMYGGMLEKAVKNFTAPLQRNGSIANVLSAEEKIYLEKKTGLDLSVYGDFWKNFKVSLYKSDTANKFYLGNPMDYIQYKILKAYKRTIAPDWVSRNDRLEYQFAITRIDEIEMEEKQELNAKKKAWKLYGKIEDNKEELIAVLKLVTNKPISKDSKLIWIQKKVEDIVDKEPNKFLNIINDKSFHTKKLINEAIDAGVIVRKSNRYETQDGLPLSYEGSIPTLDNAVEFLENSSNQEIRDIIEAKTNK